MTCVYCDKPAEGEYSVHRDGYGVGPEVPLCNRCGSKSRPSLFEIWCEIAQPSTDECAFIRPEDVEDEA